MKVQSMQEYQGGVTLLYVPHNEKFKKCISETSHQLTTTLLGTKPNQTHIGSNNTSHTNERNIQNKRYGMINSARIGQCDG
jgi:hypothetical protein